MYHFPNQPLFHHNGYQNQCPFEHGGDQEPVAHPHPYIPLPSAHYDTGTLNEISTHVDTAPRQPEPPPPTEVAVKTKKKITNKSAVDTSSFSIEERVVAAVWVHERKRTRSSMSQIKQEFRQRFGREPPAKNTLLVWERKLFSTGSVCDAPRPGRPVNRLRRVQEVSASLRRAPALSLRARAAALRLPRTTLRTILRHDLHLTPTTTTTTTTSGRANTLNDNTTGKQQPKRRVKAAAPRPHPQQSVPHPPAPAHSLHYPTHTNALAHGYT